MAIDPQMEKLVDYLVSKSEKISKGTFGSEGRPWLNFDDLDEVEQFDFEALHELFSRNSSNDEYGSLRIENEAEAKDLQTAKLSADFLAGFERDVRMRRRSRVRMFIHGGSRAAANGQSVGPLRVNTIDWLTRILSEEKSNEGETA